VADFVEQALEYKWARDFAAEAESLFAAANAAPGTPDAARALVMLGEAYYRLGRTGDGDQTFSQVIGQYGDAEIQALAVTAAGIASAVQRGDYSTASDLAVNAAESWRGAELGAWALLKAGEIEREYLIQLDAAIPYYQEVMAQYPGTLAAEEAEVAIAECLGWSWEHPDEALEAYSRALDHVGNLRLRTQAVLEGN
jgi:TolA-binding protein